MESSDVLTSLLVELCVAYQHAAFMQGVRTGFRLQQELQTNSPGP